MAIHSPIRCSYIERAMCVCLPHCVRVRVYVCVLCTFHFDCILVPVHCFWVVGRLLLLERPYFPTPSTTAEPHVPPPFTAYCASSALLVCVALRVRGAPPCIPLPLLWTHRLPPPLRLPLPRLFSTSSSRLFQRAAKLRLTHASSPAAAAAAGSAPTLVVVVFRPLHWRRNFSVCLCAHWGKLLNIYTKYEECIHGKKIEWSWKQIVNNISKK